MNKKSIIVLISLLAIILAAPAFTGRGGVRVGGYTPISDLNYPHVQEIAKYAISTHNANDGSKLEFVKVVKGESQVVAGTNYRLVISANDGGAGLRDYRAVVYERIWQNYRNLTSFTPV